MGNNFKNRINNYFSLFRNYVVLFKIDRKLLIVCILSLLVPITLNGFYFSSGYIRLIREHEIRSAQNNVDKIENNLTEITGKAVDIANRIYVNSRIHNTVAVEYQNLLDIYNAYNEISMFDDYLRSYKEIAVIRLYVENTSMLNNSYFIVADERTKNENWYNTAKELEGRMFWINRYDAISRSQYISLVRQVQNTVTGNFVGILCVNLDKQTLEQICAAELYETFISVNGEVICPAGFNNEGFSTNDYLIITNKFIPRQSVQSVFEITNIIPQKLLFAPVYSMVRKSLVIFFVSFVVSLALILQIVNEVYIQKLQKERLFSRQKEMQLKILSNQINPHFLYNTLETIRMMALEKNEKEIAVTITMLSGILRQSLSASEKTVPLEKEVLVVRNYLEIQKLRYGARLEYSIEMEPELGGFSVLPLLIQPLVENSFVHGLEKKTGVGFVRIVIRAKDNLLYIDVSDNGAGMEGEYLEKLKDDLLLNDDSIDDHIGLINVNRRIKLFYGSGFGLTIGENSSQGFNVRMSIPITGENTGGGGV
jgi:two-component system sensor histidine kinase YesM